MRITSDQGFTCLACPLFLNALMENAEVFPHPIFSRFCSSDANDSGTPVTTVKFNPSPWGLVCYDGRLTRMMLMQITLRLQIRGALRQHLFLTFER